MRFVSSPEETIAVGFDLEESSFSKVLTCNLRLY